MIGKMGVIATVATLLVAAIAMSSSADARGRGYYGYGYGYHRGLGPYGRGGRDFQLQGRNGE
jgi:hypothetical protein